MRQIKRQPGVQLHDAPRRVSGTAARPARRSVIGVHWTHARFAMNAFFVPAEWRIVVFGLRTQCTIDELHALLGRWADTEVEIEIVIVSEAADDAMAILRLRAALPYTTWRLAQRLDRRVHDGRRLRSWIPVMAWQR
ncbi:MULTISPECIES: hypothetical protein [unclassified Rubrivivax]|uniref:hypothetical protein n=1 Tax=unclassified Rubrivivax TaxID=2649762 RepID=UPI001E432653|nr:MULTISPECIES: hypothetical protein [unclassified Rubrivivax]MCC9598279.1 hypothetical protein [Rubrivivax sp. JA1055]MCC9645465.1 hypothetical protein [Rubrivivax sp. JA1029]MCD0417615.1 hypothetical protein [Rubrivivax sp. JA1024]